MGRIIWLNGLFGGGKTVTAFELHRRLPGSMVFDPEEAGYYLRHCQPKALHSGNFQDDPLWRAINLAMLRDLAARHGGVILVPMTLFNPDYYHEIITTLRREGHKVDHYILRARPETVRRRLLRRFQGRNSWAVRHIEPCLRAFSAPPFENVIDTDTLSIPQVAEAIAAASGLGLKPRDRIPGLFSLKNLFTRLGHIR